MMNKSTIIHSFFYVVVVVSFFAAFMLNFFLRKYEMATYDAAVIFVVSLMNFFGKAPKSR